MDEEIERLVVSVRADTGAFRRDVAEMRGALEGPLEAGIDRAGRAIETTLSRAIRTGKLGFEDLRTVALQVLGEIASSAIRGGIASIFGGKSGSGDGGAGGAGGGIGGGLLSAVAGLIGGLPGRATGGPVAPGAAYVVGERGPELFVPTASGTVVAAAPPPPPSTVPAVAWSAPVTRSTVVIDRAAPVASAAPALARVEPVASIVPTTTWFEPITRSTTTSPGVAPAASVAPPPSQVAPVVRGTAMAALPLAVARVPPAAPTIAAPVIALTKPQPMTPTPSKAPRLAAPPPQQPRDVRIAITVNARAGESSAALQQSSRQVARAVRAALTEAG